jgi:hypothetical protein
LTAAARALGAVAEIFALPRLITETLDAASADAGTARAATSASATAHLRTNVRSLISKDFLSRRHKPVQSIGLSSS